MLWVVVCEVVADGAFSHLEVAVAEWAGPRWTLIEWIAAVRKWVEASSWSSGLV